jgi:hypothetical protein
VTGKTGIRHCSCLDPISGTEEMLKFGMGNVVQMASKDTNSEYTGIECKKQPAGRNLESYLVSYRW